MTEVALLSDSDVDLVARSREGDRRAFDQLVERHQGRVYALAYRILGHAHDAADVQQETFVRAWRALGKFRGDSELSTWLHRITVNLCLSHKRRCGRVETEPVSEESPLHSVSCNAVARMESAETAAVVQMVLAAMPAHHRVLLVLREIEERSYDEIAGIFGCSVQSARVRASRARDILRKRLRPYLAEEQQ